MPLLAPAVIDSPKLKGLNSAITIPKPTIRDRFKLTGELSVTIEI